MTLQGMKTKAQLAILRTLLTLAVLSFLLLPSARLGVAQEQPSAQPSQQTSAAAESGTKQSAAGHASIGQELAKETREAAGEDEEENVKLKHAKPVQWLAAKIGWSVHATHLLLSAINFAIIVVVVFWAVSKFVPGVLHNRNASIQRALEEARAASHEANRRLADIENRLRQLDVEIGQMQATAEKEAGAEEIRIKKAAEEDVRKVVLAAEQEIAAAAKQARRELSTHTAGLAIALARQQIHVDSNTDQVLVRTFASGLVSRPSGHDDDNHGGKDGR
ncbi:MAG: ATP synthase F0 subunit B [Terriglobales bacterium]